MEIGLLLLALAQPVDAFLARESVPVHAVRTVPALASAQLWRSLPSRSIWTVPQQTIHLNDAKANRALASAGPREVKVRAAHDDRSLAIALEWADDTESRAIDVDRFGDSAALQLPMRFGAGVRLPYIGMGDAEQHVALYLQRAAVKGSVGREMVAAGFGSSTRADAGSAKMSMHYDRAEKTWRAVFMRPLAGEETDLRRGLVPFAIAVWDGDKNERGANKALSGWRFLRLSRWPLDPQYAGELSFGYAPGDLGDASRGKGLVESICVACHHVGDVRTAPKAMAPDLASIGLIATPRYLYDAIMKPNDPVVNHLHSASPMLQWSARDMEGATASKMPSFDTMSKQEVADMVAYLWSLGRTP